MPWLGVFGYVVIGLREPRELPAPSPEGPTDTLARLPSVRVVVPARNEARSIEACVASLAAQHYPDFRIVVVDDRSSDGTAGLAAAVPRDRAQGVEVRAGEPLPDGWFGKPWACWQGARDVGEDFLLFTDADTRHAPELLDRAVRALAEDDVAAVSLLGRQELGSFWERLVQPQIFLVLGLRYPRLARPLDRADAPDAIANGQYILVARAAYEAIGGHRAVRGEVVEDLRLAQLLTGGGHRLSIRGAGDDLSTRMYRSLGEIVEGWTKNFSVGARQSASRWGAVALPGIVAFQLLMWVLPPLALVFPGLELGWAAGATLLALVTWVGVYHRFEVSVGYALLFPLGALMVAAIAVRSGLRGRRRIEWKGRRYSAGGSDSSP